MVFDVEYVNAHLADMEWERLISASVQAFADGFYALGVSMPPLQEKILHMFAEFVQDMQRIGTVTHDDQNPTTA